MRFDVPANREAYDADLQQFRKRVSAELEKFQNRVATHPSPKTDILGTLRLAGEEFSADTKQTSRTVIVLSDFIQDDGTLDFKSDPNLHDEASAGAFARELAKSESQPLRNVRIYLGGLRSSDLGNLDKNRRNAIREFWVQYLTACGAQPSFQTDGPGMLRTLVQSSKIENTEN